MSLQGQYADDLRFQSQLRGARNARISEKNSRNYQQYLQRYKEASDAGDKLKDTGKDIGEVVGGLEGATLGTHLFIKTTKKFIDKVKGKKEGGEDEAEPKEGDAEAEPTEPESTAIPEEQLDSAIEARQEDSFRVNVSEPEEATQEAEQATQEATEEVSEGLPSRLGETVGRPTDITGSGAGQPRSSTQNLVTEGDDTSYRGLRQEGGESPEELGGTDTAAGDAGDVGTDIGDVAADTADIAADTADIAASAAIDTGVAAAETVGAGLAAIPIFGWIAEGAILAGGAIAEGISISDQIKGAKKSATAVAEVGMPSSSLPVADTGSYAGSYVIPSGFGQHNMPNVMGGF